jgi:hypothetical protein
VISQEGKPASSRTRARGRATVAAALGVLTLLAAAVGARGAGTPAQAVAVADLGGLRDQAVAVLDRLQVKGSTGYSVGIEPSRQRIGVYVFMAPGAPQPDLVGLRASLGADANLHIVTGTAHPQARIRSGGTIVVDDGQFECTNGFAITLSNGRQGFLATAHCFDLTRPANQQSAHTGDGLPLTGLEYNHRGGDWGIYALDNTTDEAAAEVNAGNEVHPVRAVAPPGLDMPICKSGIATGTTCGEITLLDSEVVVNPELDANGVVIVPSVRLTGMIQDNVCSEAGDSGAPVYTEPARGQNVPVDAVAILQGGETRKDASGKDVCLDKIDGPGTSVGYAVPLAAISAATTNPFTVKTSR